MTETPNKREDIMEVVLEEQEEMKCVFQKYQNRDKCGARIAFIVIIRQCSLFFRHTWFYIFMHAIGYLDRGRTKRVSVLLPELSKHCKGRLSGPSNASKWANYVVPESSRLNTAKQYHIPEEYRWGNLNTLHTKLHHKLSLIILSSDIKQNLQLIELL